MTTSAAISSAKTINGQRHRALQYALKNATRRLFSAQPSPRSYEDGASELRGPPLITITTTQPHALQSYLQATIADVMPPETFSDYFEPDSPPHTQTMEPLDYSTTVSGTFDIQKEFLGKDIRAPTEQRPIAKLAHGLDRVLFNPGVHWLRDPRSRVYNFSPWLQTVPKLSTFDFDRAGGFVKSSRDNDLWAAAQRENCQFAGSTSSLTGMLSHIYFLFSRMQPVDLSSLSRAFESADDMFTYGQRLPASVILNYKEGVYLTDADPGDPSEVGTNVLSFTGTMLEKFLTVSKAEYQTFLRDSPIVPDTDHRREAYRYAKFGKYVMRSQLDCQDGRLPGTGVFDIKTRAALPVRMDPMNIEEASGYLLRSLQGRFESFEREYYDLIRSAFLKYSFQARIGNMDGIMVTYHNTSQIFGFQYVPLEEMDQALYGKKDIGPRIFEACVRLLEAITTEIVSRFPEQSVACLWKTPDDGQSLQVFVEPTEWDPDSQEEKPIVQLNITVDNFLNGARYHEHIIPELSELTSWQINYSIGTVDDDYDVIRARRQEFVDIKRRFWALPSGMTVKQMEEFWKSGMGIGRAPEGEFNPERFREASFYLQHLRSRARMGAIDTMRLQREERGKKKVVWKQSDGLEEWEQDVIDEGLELSREVEDNSTTPQGRDDESKLPPPLRLMNDIQRPIMELLSTMEPAPSFPSPTTYVVQSHYRAGDAEEPQKSIFRMAEVNIVDKETSKDGRLKLLRRPLLGLPAVEAALLAPRLWSRVRPPHTSIQMPLLPMSKTENSSSAMPVVHISRDKKVFEPVSESSP